MRYTINFVVDEKQNDSRLFEILQDALTKGLKAVSYADVEVILGIKEKMNAISEESTGNFCAWCGNIIQAPAPGTTFYRRLSAGTNTLSLSQAQLDKVESALDTYAKPYSIIEECMALHHRFLEARAMSQVPKAEKA